MVGYTGDSPIETSLFTISDKVSWGSERCHLLMATVLISIISIQLPLISKCFTLKAIPSFFLALFVIYGFIPFLFADFELIRVRVRANTFSMGIDIQIIADSFASTPWRLMCLDRHTSSNFIVVNCCWCFCCCYCSLIFTSFPSIALHCTLDTFIHIHLTERFEKQEAVSICEPILFSVLFFFVNSHPPHRIHSQAYSMCTQEERSEN